MKHCIALMVFGAFALSGCPKGLSVPGVPDVPGTASTEVNPNSCGSYASSDAGKKLKAFLKATVRLEDTVRNSDSALNKICGVMAAELQIPTTGETGPLCKSVANAIKDNLHVSLKANAELTVTVEPAVCTIDINATAKAAARCEGSAGADVGVTCVGTCNGTCDGTCDGSTTGGQCKGTCDGACNGTCDGHAKVDASAECRAEAEVNAGVEAKCTKPTVDVEIKSGLIVDATKVNHVKAALMKGMPQLLQIQAQVQGPLVASFKTWSASASALASSSRNLIGKLGNDATCVAGQLTGAAAMVAGIQASLDVQLEVSLEVSASASASGSAQ